MGTVADIVGKAVNAIDFFVSTAIVQHLIKNLIDVAKEEGALPLPPTS